MKRQQRTPGAIIRIDLENGYYNYGQILKHGIAFFDIYTKDSELKDLNVLLETPVLFIVDVYNDIITRGRWLKVGKLPIRDSLKIEPIQYIQDALNPLKFRLYNPNTGKMTPATREECLGLEVAAVWDYNHVEDRIRDHYDGIPCKWTEILS